MAVLISVYATPAGQLRYAPNIGGATIQLTLPTGVTAITTRPTYLQYKKTAYILGHYSANIVVNRYLQVYTVGIEAPVVAPIIAAAGTGINADDCYGYYTFVHKVGDKVMAESSPSPPSNNIVLANQGVQWTNIPTTSSNPRVTHVRGYRVVNGGDGRMAWERELGSVSTLTESVATLALAQVINFNRGVPPNAVFGELYHDRLWYVDRTDRTRVWFSELFEPESVGPLSFFTTWDGEFITGIKKHGDVLLIFSRSACYVVAGWEASDLVMRKISPSVGCISHWAIVDINGRTWFPSMEGVYFYDGAFRHMMKDISSYWRDDYLSNTANYENSVAADDRFWNGYKILIPQVDTTSLYYFGHYKGVEPELEGSTDQPKWVWDIRARTDYSIGIIRNNNSRRDEFYTGSCDGLIRKENVASDATDDGDAYNKRMTIRFKHYPFDDPGGDIREGKAFKKLWTYVEAENNDFVLQTFGGDEDAGDSTTPSWSETVPLGASPGFTTKAVYVHLPEKTSGRGLTVVIYADFAKNMSVRGFGGVYRTFGHAARGVV